MKIVDAKVIVCSPGRNFVTLKIVTEDGIYGLGDATLNGRGSDAMRAGSKTSGNTFTRARTGAVAPSR